MVGALQLVITGLHSTSLYTLRRGLRLAWVNGLELAQTLVSIPVTIALAWRYPSPWALVVGGLCGALLFTVASHFLPVPHRNRLRWNSAAAREIRHFGRWVFGSSAAGSLGGRTDRLLMGRFLGTAWLGIYGIAATLADAVAAVVNRLVSGVVYPCSARRGA